MPLNFFLQMLWTFLMCFLKPLNHKIQVSELLTARQSRCLTSFLDIAQLGICNILPSMLGILAQPFQFLERNLGSKQRSLSCLSALRFSPCSAALLQWWQWCLFSLPFWVREAETAMMFLNFVAALENAKTNNQNKGNNGDLIDCW